MNLRNLGIGLLSLSVLACGDDSTPGGSADTTGTTTNSSVDSTDATTNPPLDTTVDDSSDGTSTTDPGTSSTTDEPTTDDTTTGPPPGECVGMSYSMLEQEVDMTTNLDVSGLVSCNLDVMLTVTGGTVCAADDGADGYYYTIETLELADVPPVMCGLAQVGLTNLSIINTGNYMEVVVDQTGGPMAGNQSIQVLGDVEGTALGMPVGPAPLMDFIGVLPEGEVAFGGSDTTVTYSPDNTVIATAMPEVMPGIAVTVTLTGLDGEMTFAM
ncbi:MAG: hypothetical protein KDK70_09090 [Myxococcales bacterium]|nr:hypothetical protein [Myxococcales bacterium]